MTVNDAPATATPTKLMGRATGAVVVATVALANASSYAFQLITGRSLGADAYGLLAGLMTIVAIIGVSASAMQTVAAKAVSAGHTTPGNRLIDNLSRSTLAVGFAVTAALMAVSPWLARFLNVGVEPVIVTAGFVIPSLLAAVALGRIQGRMRFVTMSVVSTGFALSKLAVAVVMTSLGYGVTALIIGLLIASTTMTVAAIWISRDAGSITANVFDASTARIFGGVTLFWLLVSLGVPFARGLFTETTAGQYAAADVIGRAVLWLPGVITQITFPQVSQAVSNTESTEPLMLRAFTISMSLALGGTVGIWLVGEPLFEILYGSEYPDAHAYAWKIALATVPYAVVNLLLHHNFARNHNRFLLVLAVSGLVQVVALTFGPRTPTSFALAIGVTGVFAAIAMLPAGGWRFITPNAAASGRSHGKAGD